MNKAKAAEEMSWSQRDEPHPPAAWAWTQEEAKAQPPRENWTMLRKPASIMSRSHLNSKRLLLTRDEGESLWQRPE